MGPWWIVIIVAAFSGKIYGENNGEPRTIFDKFQPFFNNPYPVLHMEVDQYRLGKCILIADGHYLKSLRGYTSKTLTILTVTGFTQVNATHVAIADHRNHCIKILDRDLNLMEDLAGTCGKEGYRTGGVGVGRMYNPWAVVKDVRNPNKLLVTDKTNDAVRIVDLNTRDLQTVIQSGLRYPQDLQWADHELLVANQVGYISQLTWERNGAVRNVKLCGSSTPGDKIGGFDEARFKRLGGLGKIGDKMFIVGDYGNKKVKLIDLERKLVGEICFKRQEQTDCELPVEPYSLLSVGDELFVGFIKGIKLLNKKNMKEECPYNSVTIYHPVDQETARVEVGDEHTVELPNGDYEITRQHNFKMCTFYILVRSQELYIGY